MTENEGQGIHLDNDMAAFRTAKLLQSTMTSSVMLSTA
jgi:hypothetical protein